ncbi:MAG TPA: alpha-amylase family glycosyl hydrolase [Candidatus Dormibacteraeota bacterium]|nr:alpha-amylase family glycosyl hydrolase [Candidatus Dormibacteraeota bacterium]
MTAEYQRAPAPGWAKDLVIYELNPRGFTSPNGAGNGNGSGTFQSLRQKLPYLRDLGINAIWMAGHSQATNHFYGIWSAYAADRPDRIEPALGAPTDLKELVKTAHSNDIRIFLDVISHGVLAHSSLVQEHPAWFRGSSWGMADYYYQHPEFRRWWVDLWMSYALDYEIDGFRIDIALGDSTLWDEITSRLREAGKEIVVFPEVERYHFSQQDTFDFSSDQYLTVDLRHSSVNGPGLYTMQISSHDRGWEALPGNHYVIRGSRAKLGYGALLSPHIPLMFSGEEFDATPVGLPNLKQGLFGTGGPGGWLYGNQLQWSQLDQPLNAAMVKDAAAMLKVRHDNSHLLNGDSGAALTTRVPGNGASSLVPFARYLPGEDAIIVLANDTSAAITYRCAPSLERFGYQHARKLRLTDLISGKSKRIEFDEIDRVPIRIRPDGVAGGGVRVFRLRPD